MRPSTQRQRELTVTRTMVIDRTAAEVAAQFADVGHHERTGVHRAAAFHVIAEGHDWCDYDQVSRVGPRTIKQRFRLDRSDPHHQLNTVTAGMFEHGTLAFDIKPVGPRTTEVTATLTVPGSPITRIAGPLLRRALGGSLAAALGEDKNDLESGRYTRRSD